VTPFLCILRDLREKGKAGNNKMIFANKTTADIILKEELEYLFGDGLVHVLSEEKKEGYLHGFITGDLLKKQLGEANDYIYICGPPPMMKSVEEQLEELGLPKSRLVREAW
jgi:NAD(P)H-flavin reductase